MSVLLGDRALTEERDKNIKCGKTRVNHVRMDNN